MMRFRSNTFMSFKFISIAALLSLLFYWHPVQAKVTLTDETNIKLSRSLVEAGGDTSENPDVTSGLGVALVPFKDERTDHYNCCGDNYGASNLGDGDFGSGRPSDGLYAIPNAGPEAVVLQFQQTERISGIVIYNGYGNRDDGTYTLKDMNGTVLGAWTISNTGGGTNNGVDSFWLTFKTPVTTSKLVIDTTSTDYGNTNSFREIQVLSANAPPIQLAVIGDSYTAGYGDKCPPIPAPPNNCSTGPPVAWVRNMAQSPKMQPCGHLYGWGPKLVWKLQQLGLSASLVGQCTLRGATSQQLFLPGGCGFAIAHTTPAPTHTIIFAGENDNYGVGQPRWPSWVTSYWVGEIGRGSITPPKPIPGKKIHVEGNGELYPPNWQQNIRRNRVMGGFPKPCLGHPDGNGYYVMADRLLWNIQW